MHFRALAATAALFPGLLALSCGAQAQPTASVSTSPVEAVVNVDLIPSQQDSGARLLAQFVARARRDPLVVRITLIQQSKEGNHFIIEERFASSASYDRFVEANYVRAFRSAIFSYLGSPWDERLGHELAPPKDL